MNLQTCAVAVVSSLGVFAAVAGLGYANELEESDERASISAEGDFTTNPAIDKIGTTITSTKTDRKDDPSRAFDVGFVSPSTSSCPQPAAPFWSSTMLLIGGTVQMVVLMLLHAACRVNSACKGTSIINIVVEEILVSLNYICLLLGGVLAIARPVHNRSAWTNVWLIAYIAFVVLLLWELGNMQRRHPLAEYMDDQFEVILANRNIRRWLSIFCGTAPAST